MLFRIKISIRSLRIAKVSYSKSDTDGLTDTTQYEEFFNKINKTHFPIKNRKFSNFALSETLIATKIFCM